MTPLRDQTLNPWLSVWFAPRATFRKMVAMDCMPLILIFAIAYGAISAFTFLWLLWIQYPQQEQLKNFWVMILWAVGGAIYGLVYLYVGSWLYKITGRWIGGKGENWDVRIAIGWSLYPAIVSGIFYLIGVLFYPLIFAEFTFMLISVIVGIWGFILLLHLLGEAHGFSAWKALAAILIASVIVFIAFFAITAILSIPQALDRLPGSKLP